MNKLYEKLVSMKKDSVNSFSYSGEDIYNSCIVPIKNSKVFNIENVWAYNRSFGDDGKVYEHVKKVQILNPPFPEMYFEIGNINNIFDDEEDEKDENVNWEASIYLKYENFDRSKITDVNDILFIDTHQIKYSVLARVFIYNKVDRIENIFTLGHIFWVTETGKMFGPASYPGYDDEMAKIKENIFFKYKMEKQLHQGLIYVERLSDPNGRMLAENHLFDLVQSIRFRLIHTVEMALTFTHCKNVSLVERESLENKAPKIKRKIQHYFPEHNYVYSLIRIDPMRKTTSTNNTSSGDGFNKNKFHICRGHFKNFTEGKGLFGRYKGLYWWDHFTRGSKENGEVISSYKVLSPNK